MRKLLVVVLALGLGLGLGWVALKWAMPEQLRAEQCTARAGADYYDVVDLEQARWASLMSAIAMQRNLPPRAATIAIATAYQESKLHNINYGDRDSLGLFQQRPSQGWGTAEQVVDPVYAINTFYDHLVQIPGYTTMDVTDAAQAVQRSGYPEAYAGHEAAARALSATLQGQYPAGFSCYYRTAGPDSISARLNQGYANTVSVSGNKVSFNQSRQFGWSVAEFVVANAAGTGVTKVEYDSRTWTRDKGWSKGGSSATDVVVYSFGA